LPVRSGGAALGRRGDPLPRDEARFGGIVIEAAPETQTALDTQVVELLGRQRLIEELVLDGLEVAVPARDRGVDLIAYADLSRQVTRFAARPIQMKAFTVSGFSVAQKYTKIANLLLAYVWYVGYTDNNPGKRVTSGLPYTEAVEVAEAMGWTETESWRKGQYTSTSPSKDLLKLLEPHRVVPGRWRALVVGGGVIV
jgi:hypothetical protein